MTGPELQLRPGFVCRRSAGHAAAVTLTATNGDLMLCQTFTEMGVAAVTWCAIVFLLMCEKWHQKSFAAAHSLFAISEQEQPLMKVAKESYMRILLRGSTGVTWCQFMCFLTSEGRKSVKCGHCHNAACGTFVSAARSRNKKWVVFLWRIRQCELWWDCHILQNRQHDEMGFGLSSSKLLIISSEHSVVVDLISALWHFTFLTHLEVGSWGHFQLITTRKKTFNAQVLSTVASLKCVVLLNET